MGMSKRMRMERCRSRYTIPVKGEVMSQFDEPVDRLDTGSIKWLGLPDPDAAPLCIADMEFRSPEPVIAALAARARHGVFGYTCLEAPGREAVLGWLARRHRWQVPDAWLTLGQGVVPSLCAAIRAFTAPGDGVIIQTPVYHPFFSIVRANGRRLVENPLVLDGGTYRMDFNLLERQLREARLFLLCNPHNPVGRVWTPEELDELGCLCMAHDVPVIDPSTMMPMSRPKNAGAWRSR